MANSKLEQIVVALDASPQSWVVLQTAGRLAHQLKVELTGVFIEDSDLLKLASLPVASEVRIYSAVSSRLDVHSMQRRLKQLSRQAYQMMLHIARQMSLESWDFQTQQGRVTAELLKIVCKADLILLGLGVRQYPGSTARAMLAQDQCPVLILKHSMPSKPVIAAIYSGSPNSEKAVKMAAHLAKTTGGFLSIVLVADTINEARRQQQGCFQWLNLQNVQAACRWLIKPDELQLAGLFALEAVHLAVLPGGSLLAQPEHLVRFFPYVGSAIMVVN